MCFPHDNNRLVHSPLMTKEGLNISSSTIGGKYYRFILPWSPYIACFLCLAHVTYSLNVASRSSELDGQFLYSASVQATMYHGVV